jgi:hypothetical protein
MIDPAKVFAVIRVRVVVESVIYSGRAGRVTSGELDGAP